MSRTQSLVENSESPGGTVDRTQSLGATVCKTQRITSRELRVTERNSG